MLNVDEDLVVALELNTPHIMSLDLDETFNVTLLDANHCPGAVMYLFEGYFGRVLATGDFRYSPSMFGPDSPLLSSDIEACYLDNTYLNPMFADMPSRDDAFKNIVSLIETKRSGQNKVLFRIVLRNLGKEDLLVRLSQYFRTRIVVLSEKRYKRYVRTLELDSRHFVRYFAPDLFIFVDDADSDGGGGDYRDELEDYISSRQVLTIEPTGLTLCHPARLLTRRIDHIQVPYSDHSSYTELVEFVTKLRPKRVVPIVRRPLANNIDTSDITSLKPLFNPAPAIQCVDRYRLLLLSCTSVRRSARLNSFDVTAAASGGGRAGTPINQRFVTIRRNASQKSTSKTSGYKKQIEYESPQKEQPTRAPQTSLSDEVLLLDSPKHTPSTRKSNGQGKSPFRMFNAAPILAAVGSPRALRSAKTSLAPICEEHEQLQQKQQASGQKNKQTEPTTTSPKHVKLMITGNFIKLKIQITIKSSLKNFKLIYNNWFFIFKDFFRAKGVETRSKQQKMSQKRASLGPSSPDKPKHPRSSLPADIVLIGTQDEHESARPIMTSTQNPSILKSPPKPPTTQAKSPTITVTATPSKETTKSPTDKTTRTPSRQRIAEVMIEHSDKKNAPVRLDRSEQKRAQSVGFYGVIDEKERARRDTRALYDLFLETARDTGLVHEPLDLDKHVNKTVDYLLNSFFW